MKRFMFQLQPMMSRKLRSSGVIWGTTIPPNQSNIQVKQAKTDRVTSGSSRNYERISSDSEMDFQSSSSLSSSDLLRKVPLNSLRKASATLKKPSNSNGNHGEGKQTIVLELDEILMCDVPKCTYQTSFKLNLEKHKKIKHELKPFECQECDFVTGNKHSFTLHVRAHAGKAPIICQICDWPTSTLSSLRAHTKQIHETAERRKQGISRASEFGKRFKCSKCDFRAVAKQEIHLHNYSHETEQKYKCSFPGCDYRSKTACSLREHVKRHDVDAKKEFQCPLCSKLFWTRYWLNNHIHSHTKEQRTHRCPNCKYVASNGSKHSKPCDTVAGVHNAGESLEVSNIGQSLQTVANSSLNASRSISDSEVIKSTLDTHVPASPETVKQRRKNPTNAVAIIKTPTKILEKKHKCDHCDFTAAYKCKIIRHAVVHRDPNDKIYSCSFAGCDFKTNWEDYVKKHYRDMHKYTPDHTCEAVGCGFQTKWKDTFAKHQRIHEKNRKKNHQCPMCRKGFYDSEGLKRHINLHTGERKYECSLCSYVAGVSSNFYAHRRKYHPGQECEPIRFVT